MAKTEYGEVAEGVSQTREVTNRKNKQYAQVDGDGWYVHPESGQRALVQSDPLWGNTQAQAFTRLGFEFERPAEPGEVKTLPELQAEKRDTETDSLKGLSARMAQLEEDAAKKSELEKEVADLRKQLAEKEEADRLAAEEAEEKKADEASDQVAKAGEAATGDAQKESADGAKRNAEEQTKVREAATGNTNTKVTKKGSK